MTPVKIKFFAITLSTLIASRSFFASPTAADVTAKQRYPWDGLGDTTYTLTNDVKGTGHAVWINNGNGERIGIEGKCLFWGCYRMR